MNGANFPGFDQHISVNFQGAIYVHPNQAGKAKAEELLEKMNFGSGVGPWVGVGWV